MIVQSHPAGRQHIQKRNPGCLAPESVLLIRTTLRDEIDNPIARRWARVTLPWAECAQYIDHLMVSAGVTWEADGEKKIQV